MRAMISRAVALRGVGAGFVERIDLRQDSADLRRRQARGICTCETTQKLMRCGR